MFDWGGRWNHACTQAIPYFTHTHTDLPLPLWSGETRAHSLPRCRAGLGTGGAKKHGSVELCSATAELSLWAHQEDKVPVHAWLSRLSAYTHVTHSETHTLPKSSLVTKLIQIFFHQWQQLKMFSKCMLQYPSPCLKFLFSATHFYALPPSLLYLCIAGMWDGLPVLLLLQAARPITIQNSSLCAVAPLCNCMCWHCVTTAKYCDYCQILYYYIFIVVENKYLHFKYW